MSYHLRQARSNITGAINALAKLLGEPMGLEETVDELKSAKSNLYDARKDIEKHEDSDLKQVVPLHIISIEKKAELISKAFHTKGTKLNEVPIPMKLWMAEILGGKGTQESFHLLLKKHVEMQNEKTVDKVFKHILPYMIGLGIIGEVK